VRHKELGCAIYDKKCLGKSPTLRKRILTGGGGNEATNQKHDLKIRRLWRWLTSQLLKGSQPLLPVILDTVVWKKKRFRLCRIRGHGHQKESRGELRDGLREEGRLIHEKSVLSVDECWKSGGERREKIGGVVSWR